MEAAVAYVHDNGLELDAIEVVSPGDERFEPSGAPPPNAPRPVPSRHSPEVPFLAVFGSFFTFLASVFVIAGIAAVATGDRGGWFVALFPSLHLAVGLGCITHAVRTWRTRRRVYASGMSASATVDRVRKRNIRFNGRAVHEVGWTFYVHAEPFHGKRQTVGPPAVSYEEGDPIWVLYDPADPSKSVEWPPI